MVRSNGPMWASAPTGRRGSLCNHPGQRHRANRPRRGRKGRVEFGTESIPKMSSNLGQSLSQPAADSSLCTREPWGTGDADCRVALLLAMTVLILCHSEEAQRADVGIRPFYDGRGFGPPHERRGERHAESSCPTESPINHPGQRRTAERLRQRVRGMDGNRRKDHPKRRTAAAIARAALSEAESAERAAGQIRFLPDNLRVQHGVQGSETCEKPRPCSRRGYAD